MYEKRNTNKNFIFLNLLHQSHDVVAQCDICLDDALCLHCSNHRSVANGVPADDNDMSLAFFCDSCYYCSEKVKSTTTNFILSNVSDGMTVKFFQHSRYVGKKE